MGLWQRSYTITVLLAGCGSAAAAPDAQVISFDAAFPDGGLDAFVPQPDAGPSVLIDESTTGSLHVARMDHTATLLTSGHVLMVGGETVETRDPLSSIEEYDPSSGHFTEVAQLAAARSNHSATLLGDGRVLIVGGGRASDMGLPSGVGVLGSAVIYDPVAMSFEDAMPLMHARSHHAAIALPGGGVLVAGGTDASGAVVAEVERFDPTDRAWHPAGTLTTPRTMARLELDGAGGALLLGGLSGPGALGSPSGVASVERYDPSLDHMVDAGSFAGPGRFYHGTLRTSSGTLLVVGGISRGFLDAVDVMTVGGNFHSAPALPSERDAVLVVETPSAVLAIGGFDYAPVTGGAVLSEILAFDASGGSFAPVGELSLGRVGASATTLDSGQVLIAGGYDQLGNTRVDATLIRATPVH